MHLDCLMNSKKKAFSEVRGFFDADMDLKKTALISHTPYFGLHSVLATPEVIVRVGSLVRHGRATSVCLLNQPDVWLEA